MEGQSSLRKQAKLSPRILCSSWTILRSLMSDEHPVYCMHSLPQVTLKSNGLRHVKRARTT